MKPVILNCYTDKSYVSEYAPIDYSNKFLPEWWKDLSKTVESEYKGLEMPTMKTCEGFIAQYKNSITIPAWSDFALQVYSEGTIGHNWVFSDGLSKAEEHPDKQRGLYLPPTRYQHIKLVVPWVLTCYEEIDWQMLGSTWNFNKPEELLIPPGIINFKYQFGANINLFVKKDETQKVVRIDHGQPLVQLVPLTERKVELRRHLLTTEQYQKMLQMRTGIKFAGTYRRVKNILKGKCPFGG